MSLEELGDKEGAYDLYYRIIEIRRDLPDQGSNLSVNLNNLAILLQEDGKLEEADALFSEAVVLVEDIYGFEHPFMAYILNGYSGLHQDRGDYDLAEDNLRDALAIGKAIFPETHPFIGVVHYNLAELYRITERFEEALNNYELSLKQRRGSLPANHSDIANTLYSAGGILIESGKMELAENYLREAVNIRREIYEPGDRRIAIAEARLGKCLLERKNYSEAEPLLVQSHLLLKDHFGEDDPLTKRVYADLKILQTESVE